LIDEHKLRMPGHIMQGVYFDQEGEVTENGGKLYNFAHEEISIG
jgi:hypothetical protein